MTAPPDVEQRPAVDPAWDERPIVGSGRGLPWWAAVLLAFALAALAAWIDINRQNSLGRIYQGAYILGCLVAVCAVRRRNLFGPMVQPPLVFAITAIGAVVLSQPGPPFSTGLKQLIFSVALPLTSNFPTMAITTGVTVAIGLARLWFQRDPNPRTRPTRHPPADQPPPPSSRPRRDTPPPRRDDSLPAPRRDDPPPGPRRRTPRSRTEEPPQPSPPADRRRHPRDQPQPPPPRDRTRSTPPPDRRRQPPRDTPRRRPRDDYR